ncbi:AraC family transcriptional regulator ligand-binding domain-containing protein [Nocardia sp. CDC153]|uniref:helix-turn-helix domain-containing protein n=1 Tax=Nocardia sp. CDC153 TaxID=3112167 RepID=UPI002DBFA782|nr:AraC family transcriptional regulator ligand-binding domain-containing protein [Nocardia sp. CDC153]MEC3954670.1 AraC family transcriptional regulator ligand-binding domain-containing protein [Nocardia sp. CDC153]
MRHSIDATASSTNPALANTVSGHMVRIVLDAAVRSGISEAEALRVGNLDPTLLSDYRIRIPSASQYRLWTLIHHAVGDESGVRAAELAEHGRLDVWDYLFGCAPNVAEGFHDWSRYATAVCDPALRVEVTEHGSALTVDLHGTNYGETRTVINEFGITLGVQRALSAFGDAAIPVRVDFGHRAPRHHRYLQDALRTTAVHFDQQGDRIHYRIAGARADRPYDPTLRRILRTAAQHAIDEARPVPGWLESFRATVRIEMERTSGARLDAVAARMGLGGRTLQRRLADAGTSWSAELASVRREQVTALLRDTTLTVHTIALRTGYSDARALSRAFASWTGSTPDGYRRSRRST